MFSRRVAESRPAEAAPPHREPLRAVVARIPIEGGFDVSRGRRGLRIAARGVDRIEYGRESIDLRGVEQLVDESQTRAIGYAIALVADRWVDGSRNLSEILDELERHFDASGLDGLDPRTQTHAHSHTHEHAHLHRYYSGNFARPRRYEIAAAINRLRVLCAKPR